MSEEYLDNLDSLLQPGSADAGSPDVDDLNLGFGFDPRYQSLEQEHDNLKRLYGEHTAEVGELRSQNEQLKKDIELLKLQSVYTGYDPQMPIMGQAYPNMYPTPPMPMPIQGQVGGFQSSQVPYGQQPGMAENIQEDRPLTRGEVENLIRQQTMAQNMLRNSTEAAYNAFFNMYPDLDREKVRPYIEGVANAVDPIVNPMTGQRSLPVPTRMQKIHEKLVKDFGDTVLRDEYKKDLGKVKEQVPIQKNTGQMPGISGGQNRMVPQQPKKENPDRPMTEQERHKKRLKDLSIMNKARADMLGVPITPIELISG